MFRVACTKDAARGSDQGASLRSSTPFRICPAALAFALWAGGAGVTAAQPPESADAGHFKISVSVDLVVLNATVRDRKGRLVTDLGEQDFAVFEDGVRQSVRVFKHEDIPVTVGLVIDHSGSMRSRLHQVIEAAGTFVRTSNPEDRMFVVNFNEKVTMGLPEAVRFTNQPEQLMRAIGKTPATGMTALYDGIAMALERLQTGMHDKKALIVISDGGDNASKHTLDQVLAMASRSNALIYTIGIFDDGDADKNPEVLKRLAAATGGEALFPSQLSEVVAECERIARDMRNQYTLGYSSTSEQTGGYRSIQVVAGAKGKYQVRARTGYTAAASARP